jgi:hypothetical protein
MLVSKKSRSLPPPSDRILRSARAESKRLICSGEESFEPITTLVIINIAPQIMEGSPPLNADSILERMASLVGGQPPPMEPVNPHPCYHPPPPMEPVNPHPCYHPPPNVQPQYQQFHQHPLSPRTTSASGASYRSNDVTLEVTYSGTCKFITYGYAS